MAWRRDSTWSPWVWDTEPMSKGDLECRDEELTWLLQHERRNWSLINGRIITSGDPVAMAQGTYAGMAALPMPASIAGPAMSTTEAGILSAANIAVYTPMPANAITVPQMWRFVVNMRYTVGATPGTIAFTLRLGNANTSPSLGASAAITQTNLTAAFARIGGELVIKTVGAPGTNSKANSTQYAMVNTAVGGAYNSALWGTGATDASFDSTIALGTNGGGLWIGGTDAGATNHATYTVEHIQWMNFN